MRNQERIQEILFELENYWTTPGNDDMRLGQIIGNFLPEEYGNDPYFFEDQELLEFLRVANNKE